MKKVLILFLLAVFLIGCSDISSVMQKSEDISVKSEMRGCSNTRSIFRADSPEPEITTENNNLKLTHKLNHNCCKNVTVSTEVRGITISITELHEGTTCKCVCESDLKATIGPFTPGSYKVGVYHQDKDYTTEKDLLFSTNVTIR